MKMKENTLNFQCEIRSINSAVNLWSRCIILLHSFALQVEYPWGKSLGSNDHATGGGVISLTVVLNRQVYSLARVEGTGKFRGQTVVHVVEGDYELALLIKWVLEVNALRFGSNGALDGALGLRCGRFSKEKAGVFHSFGTGELENTTAISNCERLIADVNGKHNSLVRVSGSSRDGSNFSLEIGNSSSISSLNLYSVSSCFLHEVSELKGLHLVLTEGAFECKRALRSGCSSLQVKFVLKVTKDWVLQD